ncbi:TVP38/TMEM64 family protein [Syntrophomonas palmitatica]|uniref:TVP38/TMEM64 family protein n=1 Tax=Syntrophomonas palmitatica TaxID=402877 RepID=UPI0006D002F5|nr:TVP38/TMEM64 family protein [Syntrophomonas palmitatica]
MNGDERGIELSHVDFTSINSTVLYLRGFGLYGPLVAFILFFVQGVAPIIPYMILAGAAGMLFGNWMGFCLAWSGAFAGALFLYYLSRFTARDYFIFRIRNRYDLDLRNLDEKSVFLILLICRIFPVVPTVIINVGAGISGVSWRVFASSSALGKIPWAIIYVALGNYFMKSRNMTVTLSIIALIFIISFAGIHFFRGRLPMRQHKF